MDRDAISAITHGDRPFHNPLDVSRIDEAIDRLDLGPRDRVLDVGCGPGELLVRIAERTGAGGLGVDTSPIVIEQARRRAAARTRGADLEFAVRQGVEPEGRFAAACCLGSSHALGGLQSALERLAGWIAPGGAVLLGDGFWQREPDPAFLEALGGASPDELPSYEGLLRAGRAAGLEPVWVATSTQRDWEDYEWTLIANGDAFARAHPNDPVTPAVLEANQRTRDRLTTPGGTDTLGFALIVLRVSP
jgi:cyclopropane fatty-acyl-phospholipid synthase-like methyltransferase